VLKNQHRSHSARRSNGVARATRARLKTPRRRGATESAWSAGARRPGRGSGAGGLLPVTPRSASAPDQSLDIWLNVWCPEQSVS
jgi:hypothetical protein